MSEALAIPDPRKTPVPLGWCQTVAEPALEGMDWETLDDYEAGFLGVVSWLESHGIDTTEFLKAMLVVNKRRAVLLGDGRPDLTRMSNAPHERTAYRWRLIRENWDWLHPIIMAATKPSQVTQARILRLIAERKAPDDVDLPADWQSPDGRIRLLAGDFRERLEELPDESVSLILTDPPYPADQQELWSDLSKHASRVLSPKGYLLGMSGKIHLDEVMGRLDEHLHYRWMFNWPLPGQATRILAYNIRQTWKPILCYTTGPFYRRDPLPDTIPTGSQEQELDAWQQQAPPARWLIERLSPPDGLVLDPFLGAGSFGLAAIQAGRRFIGVELRPDRFAIACERLAGV